MKTRGRRTGKQSRGGSHFRFGEMTYGSPRWWLLFSFGRRFKEGRRHVLGYLDPSSLVHDPVFSCSTRARHARPPTAFCFLLSSTYVHATLSPQFSVRRRSDSVVVPLPRPTLRDTPPNGVFSSTPL